MKNNIPGVVLRFDEKKVTVEINIGQKLVTLNFPHEIFTMEIQCGTPINLSLDKNQNPVISSREITPDKSISEEFDKILNSL